MSDDDLARAVTQAAYSAHEFGLEAGTRTVPAITTAVLRALPEGAVIQWPVPMGVTLESWAECTAADLAARVEGLDGNHG